jgi:uncharacterized protein
MSGIKQQVFVNLPVSNLEKSVAFYKAIGFSKNAQFSDATGACMVLSDTFNVMLLSHQKWQGFTKKSIPDAKNSAQVMIAITRQSKADVDSFVQKAGSSGGKADPNPPADHGFMYQRSIEDPDGHIFEAFWMDMSATSQS